ncbi:MAG: hypothetical protein QM773_08170 [Hyphomonadaceae bacterium]
MRKSILIGVGLVSLALALAPAALAQAASFSPPKTSWGAPDLQGYWTNSSITKMTRPGGISSLVITPEQAKKLEDGDYNNIRTKEEKKPTDQKEGAPEKGKPLPPVGNYNAVWVDPGSHVAVINGELRSSWITEPATGRIPYKPGRGAGRYEEAPPPAAAAKPADPKTAAASAASRSYEGPESRSVGERCLVGFGNTGGPVMNNVLYNNTYQIVQSPGYALILVEMVHDARIIPIVANKAAAKHDPANIKKWLGDSVGWYEGNTLVVETMNVHPQQRGYVSDKGKMTERFTRTAQGVILYQFEIDDPDQYTQVWKGEMPLRTASGAVYEYACHEGNYGLLGILEGARQQEKRGQDLKLTADDEG